MSFEMRGMRTALVYGILWAVTFLAKVFKTLFPAESQGTSAEVVIWPAASNDRRLVAVCSVCHQALRSGFTAEAVAGPYHHECLPKSSRRSR
jgi:hypothetical protein